MKQKFFLGALMAGMAVFTACSSDDEMVMPAGVGEADGDVQEIVLQVANDGLVAKRGGRPLYSSEAAQDVDEVWVYAIRRDAANTLLQDKVVLAKKVTWTDAATYTDQDGDGTKKTVRLTGENEILPAGEYEFVAYAHKVNGANANTYTYSSAAWNAGITEGSEPAYATIVATTTGDGEEVFAGGTQANVTVTETENEEGDKVTSGFAATILMARQVAGGFGYFTDIPSYEKKAKTLRLLASMKNTQVEFKDFNFSTPDGAADFVADPDYVVNGKTAATADANFNGSETNDAYQIYSIDLDDWFPNGDVNNDGLLNKDDKAAGDGNWVIPSEYSDNGVKFKSGSVFAGKFIIPFAAQKGKVTMQLQLLDEGGIVLKSWDVTLPSSEVKDAVEDDVTESTTTYSIVHNHMYNVGKKMEAKPDDPDTDNDDDPESLILQQELQLKVMSNWEMLHQMGLE